MAERRRLASLQPLVAVADLRTVKPPPKEADPYYYSPEHRTWRGGVIARAGGRCEWLMPDGSRCGRAERRMFADHVDELRDGGARLGTGQCLCGSHHTLKTAQARAARMARG